MPKTATSIRRCTASTRAVLRSRHSASLVAGSSKKAGTGNCWTIAPKAEPNLPMISLA
jgi:hypothetical protein